MAQEGFKYLSVASKDTAAYVVKGSSKYACPLEPQDGLSLGWILIITLSVSLVVYIVSGILINKYYKKKETTVELIPHFDMWRAAPGLIKDGVVFTAFKIRHPKESPNYTSL